MRIAHVITRMIIGGAQENTLFTCEDLLREHGDDVLLITGPALGPEGDLLTQGRGVRVPVTYVPSLRRAIHPWRDPRSYLAIKRILRRQARCASRPSFTPFTARRFILIRAGRRASCFGSARSTPRVAAIA
jgi:hypothetical protein